MWIALWLEVPAPSQAALLDCCSQSESVAFTAVSDGSITRFPRCITAVGISMILFYLAFIGELISAGLDKKGMSWDTCLANPLALFRNLGAEIDSISFYGFDLMVAVGAAVSIDDLRNYGRAEDLKEPFMDEGISCTASVPNTILIM
ncbi:hypothetical protein SADUNF_Sadunf08G0073700 [Salix dunnii]|uniref:Uncharacterized protein n=1 Tax=Salix dunnii TaxID=1413687 RepID=A0A835JZP1_9ROSI|nr:hypothetical protein SADUNF_Sadunf08G0073700 [Salix dunnii]